MSTIWSRTPDKKAKKICKVDPKISGKFCSITYLHLLSPNPSILKTFPTKSRLVNAKQKEKNGARQAKEEERRESKK